MGYNMARIPKPKYNINYMVKKIFSYTDNQPLPILKECCFENEWNYDYVMQLQRDNPILSQSIRRLLLKKEIQLEKALYSGGNNTAFVFSLKQLGWKDNPEQLIVNNVIQDVQGGNRGKKLRECDINTLERLEELYDELDSE